MQIDTEQFGTVPLFDMLEPMEVADILQIAQNVATDAGDVVICEGQPGDAFYVIAKGTYEVVKENAVGREVVVARLSELSFFGEMSLVTRRPCTASVICSEAGRLTRFPITAFEERLAAGDLAAYKVLRGMGGILAARLSRLNDLLTSSLAQMHGV